MTMYFSARASGFFSSDLQSLYEAAGSWPADAVPISDTTWNTYLATPPSGMRLGGDAQGAPTWVPIVISLTQAQAQQRTTLSIACQQQIVGGYPSTALGATYTYPSQTTDQQNMIASVTSSLLPNLPATWVTPFWCADSGGQWTMRPHTAAQIQQAGADGKNFISACQMQLASLTTTVMFATTVPEVLSVTWTPLA